MTAKDINGNEIKVGDTVERVSEVSSLLRGVEVGNTYKVVSMHKVVVMGGNLKKETLLEFDGVVGRYYANRFKVIKKQTFTKSDLKDGMVVTYRDGAERLLFQDTLFDLRNNYALHRGSVLSGFNDDLSYKNEPSMDIVKVTYMDEVLWEREEPLTKEQLRIKELEEGIAKMQEELNKLL